MSDDVLDDPAADETPTVLLELVAPAPPAARAGRRILSVALVAAAMLVVGAAAAGWLGVLPSTGPAELSSVTAPVGGVGVVPEPAQAGSGATVPAPVGAPPAQQADAPATVPAPATDDVQVTGGAVPPADGDGY